MNVVKNEKRYTKAEARAIIAAKAKRTGASVSKNGLSCKGDHFKTQMVRKYCEKTTGWVEITHRTN